MRLVFVFGGFSFGGAEHVMCNLANKFDSEKHQVTLICVTYKEQTYKLNSGIKVINGIKYNSEISTIAMLRKTIKKEKPDLVLSFLTHINIAVILACFGLEIPVVVSERNDPRSIPPERLRRLLRFLTYPFASGYVFQTEDAKTFFQKKIQEKSTVIPNPLLLMIDSKPLEARKKEIISVARLVPQKRQEMILQAFIKSKVMQKGYTLHFYGTDEDNEADRLTQIAKEAGAGQAVIFHGSVNDLHNRIASSSIFILGSDYEGMPNALMEAMGLGLACISTDCPCGGPRFLIQNDVNGILVPVGDENAITHAIVRVTNDDRIRIGLGYKAMNIRQRLDESVIYNQWKAYLFSIVKR